MRENEWSSNKWHVVRIRPLEQQAFGLTLDQPTVDQFRVAIYQGGVPYLRAENHRAITGVRLADVQRSGAPTGQSTTVIIVSENSLESTRACIESLRRSTGPERPTDVIVVDNGSCDGSVQWLAEQADLTLIATPHSLGIPAARNQALQRGYGDWTAS